MTACERRKNDGRRRTRSVHSYNIIIIIMFVREDLAQNNSNKTSRSFKSPDGSVTRKLGLALHCLWIARARGL